MDEQFLLIAFRSMSLQQQCLYLRYLEALRDRLGTVQQLGEELFCSLSHSGISYHDRLRVAPSPLVRMVLSVGTLDRCPGADNPEP